MTGPSGDQLNLDDHDLSLASSLRWSADPDFEELPGRLLGEQPWKTVVAKSWAFSDTILQLEARACVNAVERF